VPTVSDSVWSARDTTPGAIEAALRRLLAERHHEHASYAPARALNLVCIVDREWSGEIANRLRRVGRYHASRTIVCSVEDSRHTLDARATIASEVAEPRPGEFALLRETVVVEVGAEHLPQLDRIVDPLVVTDLATVVWSPHGHDDAVDSLTTSFAGGPPVAQTVLLDSVDDPEPERALDRVCALADRAYVVDLAWLRSTPWRERIAAAFDPPARRHELETISTVTVRVREGSDVAGVLLLGWLCSRLGWRPSGMVHRDGVWRGRARARRGEVTLVCEQARGLTVPGLAGIEVRTDAGTALSLDRGVGGLIARRRLKDGREAAWTVLGASRGEAGILGEGIRQALLRDPTHRQALRAAKELL
jgi:glucose-6-phosphate dehydrogenase assembly protein OpcA